VCQKHVRKSEHQRMDSSLAPWLGVWSDPGRKGKSGRNVGVTGAVAHSANILSFVRSIYLTPFRRALWLRLQGSPGSKIDYCQFKNWQIIDSCDFRNFTIRY